MGKFSREEGEIDAISGRCYAQIWLILKANPAQLSNCADGELMLTELGLEGDEQAEKKVHGGPDRALCHYPREHYLYWAREFPEQAELFVAPAFAENLSTDGLTESNVYMGDIFRGKRH